MRPALAVVGVFKLRHREQSTFRSPGYPVVPAIYLLSGVSILVLAYLERPVESSIAVGTVLVGIPVYLWFRARAGSGAPPDGLE